MKPTEVNIRNYRELIETVFKYMPPDFVNYCQFKVGHKVRIVIRMILSQINVKIIRLEKFLKSIK